MWRSQGARKHSRGRVPTIENTLQRGAILPRCQAPLSLHDLLAHFGFSITNHLGTLSLTSLLAVAEWMSRTRPGWLDTS